MIAFAKDFGQPAKEPDGDKQIDALLNFQATELTHPDSGEHLPAAIEFGLDSIAIKAKQELFDATDDTNVDTTVDDFDRIAAELGFRVVHSEEYTAQNVSDDQPHNEQLKMLFNASRGILLSYSSWLGTADVAKLYFNWRPTTEDWYQTLAIGGGRATQDPTILAAEFDLHEGLRARIRQLDSLGEFITPWLKQPNSYWIVTHKEINETPPGSVNEDGPVLRNLSKARVESVPDPLYRKIVLGE